MCNPFKTVYVEHHFCILVLLIVLWEIPSVYVCKVLRPWEIEVADGGRILMVCPFIIILHVLIYICFILMRSCIRFFYDMGFILAVIEAWFHFLFFLIENEIHGAIEKWNRIMLPVHPSSVQQAKYGPGSTNLRQLKIWPPKSIFRS